MLKNFIIDNYYGWLFVIVMKINVSSSIYKVIRPVSNFFFFYDKISQTLKAQY